MRIVDITDAHLPPMLPGQISEPERRMLYWVAAAHWRGRGEVVEVGAFLGKSTSCLAAGIAASKHPNKAKRLHVYDRWEVNDSNAFYLHWIPELGPDFRGSFKSAFDRYTAEWADIIVTHEGDTREAQWSGKPIEILFLDCSTSYEFHLMLLRKFYRSLIPLESVLIHQDYFLHRSYYLPPMMRRLREYVGMFKNWDTSMLFMPQKPIPERVLEEPLFASDEEMLELLEEQRREFGVATEAAGILWTMLVFYHMTHGNPDRAHELAEEIRHSRPERYADPVLTNLRNALKGEEHV